MSSVLTGVVFAGIPLVVVAAVFAMVFALSRPATPRYRPGRRMEFTPVWFLAPDEDAANGRAALPSGAVGAGATDPESSAKGGARGTW